MRKINTKNGSATVRDHLVANPSRGHGRGLGYREIVLGKAQLVSGGESALGRKHMAISERR